MEMPFEAVAIWNTGCNRRLWRNFEDERSLIECGSAVSHAGARNLAHNREIRRLGEAGQIRITGRIRCDRVTLVHRAAADHERVDQRGATGVHCDNKSLRTVLLAASPGAGALDRGYAWRVRGLGQSGQIGIAHAVHGDTRALIIMV